MIPEYYLHEENKLWYIDIKEIKAILNQNREISNPIALVITNPHNPTGALLSERNVKEIIKFAYDEKLFLVADEVYENCIHDPDVPFYTFKKALMEMGEPYSRRELATIRSVSKGYIGEAGLRGGYMEVINLWPPVRANFYKTITTCPPSTSQALVTLCCKPPVPGITIEKRREEAYYLFKYL